ncbi:MAG: TRAP transporter fused permease subunit, partial [Nitrososphaerales archaeon]|nr:TRAP transporter fused permease subunit [Nitrososphaerales archaeon]
LYAARPTIERQLMSIVFLHMCITMLAIRSWIFEEYGIFKMKGRINKVLSVIFVILSTSIMIYFVVEYHKLTYWRAGAPNIIDIILGGIAMILVLETARKDTGYWIPVIVLIFLIYGYLGQHMPGILQHIGFSLFRLIEICSVELGIGIYGSLTGIAATWIAAFVMFAGFATGFGALDGIIKLAKYVAAKWKYGIPQTGVIASMFFGMCSGSAPANVAGTGSFTIPLNKSYGIPAKFAAAIEAVASSGGLIMPPIMGAAAFIIAAYLGTTYWHIVLVAFPAAFLYYATTAFSVYLISLRYMKNIVVKLEVEPLPTIVKDLSPLLVGLIVLIYLLAQLYDPLIAGFYAVLTLLITSFILFFIKFYKNGGLKLTLKEYGKGFLNGVMNGAEIAATTGVMLAAIMMIVSVLTVSGLGVKLSMGMIYISGGNLILLSLLVAIVCIVFGMGVSATAAYVLTIVIAAPAFLAIGVAPLSAHFYVFYFSILSAITPPVAIAAVVASRISGASYFSVCIESIKIGIALFILPVIFIMYPEILALNLDTVRVFIFLMIAFWGLSVGIFGYEIYPGKMGSIIRIVILALSFFVLVAPFYIGWLMTYILLFILLLLTMVKVYSYHKSSAWKTNNK